MFFALHEEKITYNRNRFRSCTLFVIHLALSPVLFAVRLSLRLRRAIFSISAGIDNMPIWEYRFEMKLNELLAALERFPTALPRFVLPDGSYIPAHAHITEVGHVVKNFIDCGGLTGRNESVVLQTHVGSDTDHRLKSDRFAKILQLGERVLPHQEFEVEVEYDCWVVSQYPVAKIKPAGGHLDIFLGAKRTQCLAQERAKQETTQTCCGPAPNCC